MLFTGKEQDKETGLQYFEARYYNPELGRFYSQDRVFWELGLTDRGKRILLDPQQLNSYSYVRNNPVVYVDPSGEIARIYANPETVVDGGYALYDGSRTIYHTGAAIGGMSAYIIGYFTDDEYLMEAGKQGFIEHNIKGIESGLEFGVDMVALAVPGYSAAGGKVIKNFSAGKNAGNLSDAEKLRQKLAMDEAVSNAKDLKSIDINIKDEKYKGGDREKKAFNKEFGDGTSTEIHLFYNKKTGDVDQVKVIY